MCRHVCVRRAQPPRKRRIRAAVCRRKGRAPAGSLGSMAGCSTNYWLNTLKLSSWPEDLRIRGRPSNVVLGRSGRRSWARSSTCSGGLRHRRDGVGAPPYTGLRPIRADRQSTESGRTDHTSPRPSRTSAPSTPVNFARTPLAAHQPPLGRTVPVPGRREQGKQAQAVKQTERTSPYSPRNVSKSATVQAIFDSCMTSC